MWNIRLARRKVRDFEQFQHPAVVPFVDVGTSGAMHYLAWPLVDSGKSLNRIIEDEGKLNAAQTALYAMYTAEGLEACHQRNIIHGMLKPSNIMITEDDQVKILDFGVGSLLRETEGESVVDTMSTANTLASGLDCASPESIMDPASASFASDQYSLGCIMYYCLTGQYPFPGNNAVEKMMAHQSKQPPPLQEVAPDTPPELVVAVERLMQKKPEDRYPSVSELIVALRPIAMVRNVAPTSSGSTKLSGLRAVPEALRRMDGAKPASGLKGTLPADSPLRKSWPRTGGSSAGISAPPPPERPTVGPGPQRTAVVPPLTPVASMMGTAPGSRPSIASPFGQLPPEMASSPDLAVAQLRNLMHSADEIRVSNYPPAQGLSGQTLIILVVAMFFSMLVGMGGLLAILWFTGLIGKGQ
jgi:serine/threonine protein kinase